MDNCVSSTKKILQLLKVEYTNEYVEDCILSHPDHPSILSISDTLNRYEIENLAVKIDVARFDKIPFPCLVQVSVRNDTLFYVLKSITDKDVVYFDDKNKLSHDSKENFLKNWTGVCLLVERGEESKEIDIEKKRVSRKFLNVLKSLAILSFLSWVFISLMKRWNIDDHTFLLTIGAYLLLKLVGIIVSILLLWYEVDKYNPTLQNFCSGGEKVNCDSVLNSRYARLLGGNLNLSIVGFSYFFGSLMYMLTQNFSPEAITLLSFLSILTFPVVITSFYYQGGLIGQWCKLCIIVQTVLIFEIILVFIGYLYKRDTVEIESFPVFLTWMAVSILAWKFINPLLEKRKESNFYKRGLGKIKNNPIVLDSLLSKSRKINTSPEDLGILIKSDAAKYHVIKVCNPYCGPCAEAHPVLDKLVNDHKVNLQIIFTAGLDDNDYRTKPVSHFLAIDSSESKNVLRKALDDWYYAETKDYEVFARKYPMNGELERQRNKIEKMDQWCQAEKITHTPTIFINGYELPKEYNINDLKDVL